MRAETKEFLEQLKFSLAPARIRDVRMRAHELLKEDRARINEYNERLARGYCECHDPAGLSLYICPDCGRYYTELSALQSLV